MQRTASNVFGDQALTARKKQRSDCDSDATVILSDSEGDADLGEAPGVVGPPIGDANVPAWMVVDDADRGEAPGVAGLQYNKDNVTISQSEADADSAQALDIADLPDTEADVPLWPVADDADLGQAQVVPALSDTGDGQSQKAVVVAARTPIAWLLAEYPLKDPKTKQINYDFDVDRAKAVRSAEFLALYYVPGSEQFLQAKQELETEKVTFPVLTTQFAQLVKDAEGSTM